MHKENVVGHIRASDCKMYECSRYVSNAYNQGNNNVQRALQPSECECAVCLSAGRAALGWHEIKLKTTHTHTQTHTNRLHFSFVDVPYTTFTKLPVFLDVDGLTKAKAFVEISFVHKLRAQCFFFHFEKKTKLSENFDVFFCVFLLETTRNHFSFDANAHAPIEILRKRS